MVLIMITIWIPYGRQKYVGQKYLEVNKKFPVDRSLEKNLVPLGVRATKKGIKVFSLQRLRKENLRK